MLICSILLLQVSLAGLDAVSLLSAFQRVKEPFEHILKAIFVNSFVEAPELARRCKTFLPILLRGKIHVLGALFALPVHPAVLALFILVHVASVLDLAPLFCLVFVYTL